MLTFLERYWFAVALCVGAVTWTWRTRRRIRAAAHAAPRPRPPSGSVGPVPFRGANFAAKVAIVRRFHWRAIGAMIAFCFVGAGLLAMPGISRATSDAAAGAAAVGAFVSWLALAIREGPLLRRLGLYCPQCRTPLVGGSDDMVPTEIVVSETGQCRCGAWLLDPADLPSGQGPDESYLPPSRNRSRA